MNKIANFFENWLNRFCGSVVPVRQPNEASSLVSIATARTNYDFPTIFQFRILMLFTMYISFIAKGFRTEVGQIMVSHP